MKNLKHFINDFYLFNNRLVYMVDVPKKAPAVSEEPAETETAKLQPKKKMDKKEADKILNLAMKIGGTLAEQAKKLSTTLGIAKVISGSASKQLANLQKGMEKKKEEEKVQVEVKPKEEKGYMIERMKDRTMEEKREDFTKQNDPYYTIDFKGNATAEKHIGLSDLFKSDYVYVISKSKGKEAFAEKGKDGNYYFVDNPNEEVKIASGDFITPYEKFNSEAFAHKLKRLSEENKKAYKEIGLKVERQELAELRKEAMPEFAKSKKEKAEAKKVAAKTEKPKKKKSKFKKVVISKEVRQAYKEKEKLAKAKPKIRVTKKQLDKRHKIDTTINALAKSNPEAYKKFTKDYKEELKGADLKNWSKVTEFERKWLEENQPKTPTSPAKKAPVVAKAAEVKVADEVKQAEVRPGTAVRKEAKKVFERTPGDTVPEDYSSIADLEPLEKKAFYKALGAIHPYLKEIDNSKIKEYTLAHNVRDRNLKSMDDWYRTINEYDKETMTKTSLASAIERPKNKAERIQALDKYIKNRKAKSFDDVITFLGEDHKTALHDALLRYKRNFDFTFENENDKTFLEKYLKGAEKFSNKEKSSIDSWYKLAEKIGGGKQAPTKKPLTRIAGNM